MNKMNMSELENRYINCHWIIFSIKFFSMMALSDILSQPSASTTQVKQLKQNMKQRHKQITGTLPIVLLFVNKFGIHKI